MVGRRNPFSEVRSTTFGIIALTGLWTAFQVFDPNPPPVLDQILVAAFGLWFASETKRNKSVQKKAASDRTSDEDEDD